MSNWKDQLRNVKRTLRQASPLRKQKKEPQKDNLLPRKSRPEDSLIEPESSPKRTSSPIQAEQPPGETHAVSSPKIAEKHGSRRSNAKSTSSLHVFKPYFDGSKPLTMPDWAEIGEALQHPEARGGPPLLVRLGIDFGTAFTKVGIRAGPDLVAVDWSTVTGDESPTGRWVVPGFVCRGSGGEYGWGNYEGGVWLGNLKLPLVEGSPSVSCPCSALAYLAEVIRYSRAFLFRHPVIGRKLANRTLRWELNLGCPTEPHEKPEIVERFTHLARTAWWLAGQNLITESTIRTAWDRQDLDAGLETEPGVIPEFVAQIAGYLKSTNVNDGLHTLIDVGAATLDVATFNVVLPREDTLPRIPIFFSAVKSLGTHFLSYERYSMLDLEFVWNDANPVDTSPEFARQYGKDVNEVNTIDAEFANRVVSCIFGVINGTRTFSRGDPSSPAWRKGLPVFVTGGGSSCEVYGQAIIESEAKIKSRICMNRRFRFIRMNLSQAISSDVDSSAAGRLTVAIGLTEDAEDIAHIVPHRDIESLRIMTSKPRPDRDELYPK